jgi:hypothetical protein
MSHAKGSILIHFREYVKLKHGEDALARVLQALPEEDRAILSGLVIHGGWYPVGVWNRALKAFLPAYYADPDEGMRSLAEFIAAEDLSTVYRMVLKVGSPEFLMKRTTSLWSRDFDAGSLTAEEVRPRQWRLYLTAPRDIEAAPDFFTCGPGVRAWITQALKLTGVNASLEHVRCRLSSADRCEYSARW